MSIVALPLVGFVADLVCPERCASCGAIVRGDVLFCRTCAHRTLNLGPPECAHCGAPGVDPCGRCTSARPPIRSARAWASYRTDAEESPVAGAIGRFKYGGVSRLGRRIAAAMSSRVFDATVELIIPVPLHARRLRERGYNQSAILARELARRLDARLGLTMVVRTRPTPSQVGLSMAARAANVTRAFHVRRPDLVRGRTVLLVDDVWTSGATARAVAATLHAAGATSVDVLTFARVI
jgi:ComF family protein